MSKLSSDIQDSIKKNLPSQVADSLKEYLADAEKAKNDKKILEAECEAYKEDFERSVEIVRKLEAKVAKYTDLEEREAAVIKKEQEQALVITEIKLAEAEKRAVELSNLVALVFKSPVYRKVVDKQFNGYSNDGAYNPNNERITETIESE